MLAYDIRGDYPPFECSVLESIVAAPLKYLGKGRQSIAFQSSDGQYVLKFFLLKQLRISMLLGQAKPVHLWPLK